MPKSKNVEGFINTLEKAITCLSDLIKTPKKEIPAKEEKPQPTLEEVRTVLADLSRRGYTTNVRMMLIGFGVSKLSEVDPKDYAELLAKAKELDDATKD